MANKSIIDIDINDQQFRAFYELFQEYRERVASVPDDWRRADEAMKRSSASMGQMSDLASISLSVALRHAHDMAGELRAAVDAQKAFSAEVQRSDNTLQSVAKSAAKISDSFFGIGKSIVHLISIGGALTGIGSVLGALSLHDLAADAVSTQKGARSVGLSPGAYKAFGQDFSNFVDPSILSTIAHQQGDLTGRMWLSTATGIGQDQISNMGPDQLAINLMQRAQDWWNNTPGSARTAQSYQVTGLDQSGLSFDEARRLGNTPRNELQQQIKAYGPDSRQYNMSNGTVNAWYQFEMQLQRAGSTIETSLTNRLAALAPQLQSLIGSLTKDAEILVGDILTPQNLKMVSGALAGFVKELSSDDLKKQVASFGSAVKTIADDTVAVAKVLDALAHPFGGGSKDTANGQGASSSPSMKGDTNGLATPLFSGGDGSKANARNASAMNNFVEPAASFAGILYGQAGSAIWQAAKNYMTDHGNYGRRQFGPDFFAAAEKANGLPPGFLFAQAMAESGGNPNAVSPSGAKGLMQFMNDTGQQYGLTDPFNAEASRDAGGRYDHDLMRKYKGDVAKVLAAYNWGQGDANHPRLDADIARYGNDWRNHLPSQTEKYLERIAETLHKMHLTGSTINLNMSNSAGADVAVQAAVAGLGN